MNVPDLFVKRWESEQAAFGKVLRAIPGEQLAYRPHERSTSAGLLNDSMDWPETLYCNALRCSPSGVIRSK